MRSTRHCLSLRAAIGPSCHGLPRPGMSLQAQGTFFGRIFVERTTMDAGFHGPGKSRLRCELIPLIPTRLEVRVRFPRISARYDRPDHLLVDEKAIFGNGAILARLSISGVAPLPLQTLRTKLAPRICNPSSGTEPGDPVNLSLSGGDDPIPATPPCPPLRRPYIKVKLLPSVASHSISTPFSTTCSC